MPSTNYVQIIDILVKPIIRRLGNFVFTRFYVKFLCGIFLKITAKINDNGIWFEASKNIQWRNFMKPNETLIALITKPAKRMPKCSSIWWQRKIIVIFSH